MLKAEGSYVLPTNVPANEFLNLEGQKLSTSKNWAVWLHEYLEDFPGKQDVLRYVLTANAPENKDNDFTWRDFQARNDNELVAIYGNFINRIVVLTHKYYQGVVPAPNHNIQVDEETLDELRQLPIQIATAVENYRFREASQILLKVARLGNKYLADEEPWKQQKTNPERVKTIMYNGLQIAAVLAIASTPFLPQTANKLKTILGLPLKSNWSDMTQSELVAVGTVLATSELLFSKVEDDDIQIQFDKLKNQTI